MALEQLGQHGQDIIALELALDMDRQALAAVRKRCPEPTLRG